MKFGHEYEQDLASQGFPQQWLGSAIDYKFLKKCINTVRHELEEIGLDAQTLSRLTDWVDSPQLMLASDRHEFYSAVQPSLSSIAEEFCPQLRVLVDSRTGAPLDATLAPETKAALKKLAQHEMITAGRQQHLGRHIHAVDDGEHSEGSKLSAQRSHSLPGPEPVLQDVKWIQLPLSSAKTFFDLLEPKLEELETLRNVETLKLEEEILDLGFLVEDVIQPVREGFEARREVSYRDLYFWREMFRLYMENPVFYSNTEQQRGALTYPEARKRLEAYDRQLRSTGLLAKMKTPQAKLAAQHFLDLNLDILKIMAFQEMNARAMTKIMKKFDKRTHLEGQLFLKNLRLKHPELLPTGTKRISAGGFANSIARDMYAEISSKVLSIVPQVDDWSCPVCLSMAWKPVSLGCCTSRFCIRCVIKMQDENMTRCPCCNSETVAKADGRNIDFEAMDFLEKYFPLEVKKRQKDNEKAQLVRNYGEEFVKPGCLLM